MGVQKGLFLRSACFHSEWSLSASQFESVTMIPLFLLVNLLILATITFAAAPPAPSLKERRASSSSYPAGAPGIVTKVTSPNGTDLTSGFQTLFYHDNDIPSNLTDRDLEERQSPDRYVRFINLCARRGAEFQSSYCHYQPNHPYSLQRYLVTCNVRLILNGRPINQIITEQVSGYPWPHFDRKHCIWLSGQT